VRELPEPEREEAARGRADDRVLDAMAPRYPRAASTGGRHATAHRPIAISRRFARELSRQAFRRRSRADRYQCLAQNLTGRSSSSVIRSSRVVPVRTTGRTWR